MTRTEIIDYLLAIRTEFQSDLSFWEHRAIAEAIEIVEKGACDTDSCKVVKAYLNDDSLESEDDG